MTKMEAPFEELLDQLEHPVEAMLGDVELPWTISMGNRRNIPVASVSTMPAVFFSMLHHWDFSYGTDTWRLILLVSVTITFMIHVF